jgi:tetratricopeptide (TPR) repeat protein
MSELAGQYSKEDIGAGFTAVFKAASAADLETAINALPVLRAPIFHTEMRQYRLRMQPESANFLSIYDGFFLKLHYRAFMEELKSNPPGSASGQRVDVYAPAFYLQFTKGMLGGKLPPLDGRTYDPAKDTDAIAHELESHLGKKIELQSWQPSKGSRWAAILMACRRCPEIQLTFRAQLVDLTVAQELREILEQKRINSEICQYCGATLGLPVRVWIQEQPGATDPLGVASWICRPRATEAIYLPPPGTLRNSENDVILEVRQEILLRQLGQNPFAPDAQVGMQSYGVAYGLDELLRRLSAGSSAYEDMVQSITEKLESGLMPLYQVEQFIRQIVPPTAKKWPVITASPAGQLREAVVRNLIAEVCAEAQGASASTRAQIAGLTVQCYTGLGEFGLAEANLARAEDLLANEPPSLSLLNVKAELLSAQGHSQEAEQLRNQVLAAGKFENRAARQDVIMNNALEARKGGRLAEALEGMRTSAKTYEELAKEALGDATQLAEIRHSQSGALANLGIVCADIASNFELIAVLSTDSAKRGDLSPRLREIMSQLGSVEAYTAMHDEMTQRVMPLLDPAVRNPPTLRREAESLLRSALAISEEMGSYDYAAIQSRSLAVVLDDQGKPRDAEAMMDACLRYAARVTDYHTMSAASLYLADKAQAEGDGARQLDLLRGGLRFYMREAVRRGAEYQPGLAQRIARDALHTVTSGGHPLDAILVAESTKAIATSISLSRGVPLQATAATGPLQELLKQREALRIKTIWNKDESSPIEQQLSALEHDIDKTRSELSLRDERFVRWRDATYLDVTEAHVLDRILGDATFAGFVDDGDAIFCYAAWKGGQIVERPMPSTPPALIEALGRRLDSLRPEDQVFISPCESLEQFPFSRIVYRQKTLCEQVNLCMTWGLSVLEASAERPFLQLKRALCVGAPTRPNVPDLPGAKDEVGRIVDMLEKAHVSASPALTGRDATVAALSKKISDCDVVHFACHAVASDSGGDGQLLLAPDLISRDSGVLSEDRIVSTLSLKFGSHVNMAACRSGGGKGEGRYYHRGLIPAFLVAGAGSVMGSLWVLEDGPAARFQAAYYERLIQGTKPGSALAKTQRDCIAGKLGDDMKLAANWAGYVLYGKG